MSFTAGGPSYVSSSSLFDGESDNEVQFQADLEVIDAEKDATIHLISNNNLLIAYYLIQ